MNYAPRPLEDYRLHGVGYNHVDSILSCEHPIAAWNLVWLSMPTIDLVPDNKAWHKVFHYPKGSLSSLLADVVQDDLLRHKLTMPPLSFSSWFQQEDHTLYDTFETLGPAWPNVVVARAAVAHARMEAELPRWNGNVVRVTFGKRA